MSPDAGGLVIATDQDSARAYAALLKKISGEAPTIVLSDEKSGSKKIAAFTDSEDRWMVAVRMVSEGVDVPRLAVGVYATAISTPLFFAQAVGRFVRARARGETASVFLPSVPHLLGFAAEMEVERDHVLGRRITDESDLFAAEQDLLDRANADVGASDELEGTWQALGSQARFDRVVYDGGEFGHAGEVHVGSEEEMDFLGIPGLLEPDQMRELLQHRQRSRRTTASAAPAEREVSTHEQLAILRRELNGLVAAYTRHRPGRRDSDSALRRSWRTYRQPGTASPTCPAVREARGSVFTGGVTPDSPALDHHRRHGDGVVDIAIEVPDVDVCIDHARAMGATVLDEPHDVSDEHGTVRIGAIATYGETRHTLVDRSSYDGPFLPGYASPTPPRWHAA